MTDDQFKKLNDRFDEVWAHKETVSSKLLRDIQDKYLKELDEVKRDISVSLDKRFGEIRLHVKDTINTAIKQLRSDLKVEEVEMRKDIESLKNDRDKHDNYFNKVVWILITAIILAGLALIFKEGLI